MQIKYRIGIMPGQWPAGPDGRDLFWRVIETCERTEIDSIWFSDRLSSPIPVLEPIIAMAAVAARTQRLKFGPSVLVAPFRAPVLAARQLAMLDYLSGGRALPAVGIGVEQEREFRAGVENTCAFAAEARREVPGDHFGALVNFWLDDDPARARATAAPFVPRGRVDNATLAACTAFGPPELLADRLEEYVAGGGSKFIVRPMGPPDRMLEQLERLAAEVIPA